MKAVVDLVFGAFCFVRTRGQSANFDKIVNDDAIQELHVPPLFRDSQLSRVLAG